MANKENFGTKMWSAGERAAAMAASPAASVLSYAALCGVSYALMKSSGNMGPESGSALLGQVGLMMGGLAVISTVVAGLVGGVRGYLGAGLSKASSLKDSLAHAAKNAGFGVGAAALTGGLAVGVSTLLGASASAGSPWVAGGLLAGALVAAMCVPATAMAAMIAPMAGGIDGAGRAFDGGKLFENTGLGKIAEKIKTRRETSAPVEGKTARFSV